MKADLIRNKVTFGVEENDEKKDNSNAIKIAKVNEI